MSRTRVPEALRRLVVERAAGRCEYCWVHQDDLALSHQVDHVTPVKHGGQTVAENLALACLDCNRYKGADLTAIDPDSGAIVPLFNPRTQRWAEHFRLAGAEIVGQTTIGRATARVLRLNEAFRLTQRRALIEAGRYLPGQ